MGWIELCGVPVAELLIDCVSEEHFEDVKSFVHGARELGVPPVQLNRTAEGVSFGDVGGQTLRGDSVLQGAFDGWLSH